MSEHTELLWSTQNLNNSDIVYYCQQSRGRQAFPGWNFLDRKYKRPKWRIGSNRVLPLKHHFSKTPFENQLSSRRVLNVHLVVG